MNDFGSAKQLLDRAAELTPDDPPAVGCARFPDLMRRSIALPRTPLSPSASTRRTWPVPDPPLEIVYFFMGTAGDERFGEYCRLLSASMASARRNVPACRVVLLTDRATVLPAEVKPDEIRRYDLAPAQLMVGRFRAVEAYLAEHPAARVQLENMTRAASVLPKGVSPVEPEPSTKAALMARVSADAEARTRSVVAVSASGIDTRRWRGRVPWSRRSRVRRR